MTAGRPRYWFPAKRYGWGWSFPATWQGWAVLVGYLVLILGGIPVIHARLGNVAYLVCLVALTALLVAICRLKGEPVRWRSEGR